MGKLKITCEEATMICTKSQYGESAFLERIQLGFHIMFCKICRTFSKQNNELSNVCNLSRKHEENNSSINKEDKEKWKQELKGFEKKQD